MEQRISPNQNLLLDILTKNWNGELEVDSGVPSASRIHGLIHSTLPQRNFEDTFEDENWRDHM
ncbi:hypothetical protein NMG60_11022898 [Bertholletia excelsa]